MLMADGASLIHRRLGSCRFQLLPMATGGLEALATGEKIGAVNAATLTIDVRQVRIDMNLTTQLLSAIGDGRLDGGDGVYHLIPVDGGLHGVHGVTSLP